MGKFIDHPLRSRRTFQTEKVVKMGVCWINNLRGILIGFNYFGESRMVSLRFIEKNFQEKKKKGIYM